MLRNGVVLVRNSYRRLKPWFISVCRAIDAPKSRHSSALLIIQWACINRCITSALPNRFAQVYRGLETFDWLA